MDEWTPPESMVEDLLQFVGGEPIEAVVIGKPYGEVAVAPVSWADAEPLLREISYFPTRNWPAVYVWTATRVVYTESYDACVQGFAAVPRHPQICVPQHIGS